MISGRGLGHTGGTLDKLDSIPGYVTQPDLDLFRKVTNEAGCAIIGQTADLAPADKRLYGIRDVTATVESDPAHHRLDPVQEARRRPRTPGARREDGLRRLHGDHGRGRGPGRKPGRRGQWRGPQDHRAHHRHGRAAGALRGQCPRSGPCLRNSCSAAGREPRVMEITLALGAELLLSAGIDRDAAAAACTPAPHASRAARRPSTSTAWCALLGGPKDFLAHHESLSAAGAARHPPVYRGRGRSGLSHPHARARPRRHRTGRRPPRCRRQDRPSRRPLGSCSARATSRIAQGRSASSMPPTRQASPGLRPCESGLCHRRARRRIGTILARIARLHRSLIMPRAFLLILDSLRHRRRARCRELRRRRGRTRWATSAST